MSALTRVTVEQSHKVSTDVEFDVPLEIAELYRNLAYRARVFIREYFLPDLPNEWGVKKPGHYMCWVEEDGTQKSYKLENYDEWSDNDGPVEIVDITFASTDSESESESE